MTARQTIPEGNAVVTERMAVRIVSLLLIVAAVCVFVLWSANPMGSGSETTFALFLGADLVAVAMISYVQRSVSEQESISRAPLIAGCCFVLVLVVAGIYLL